MEQDMRVLIEAHDEDCETQIGEGVRDAHHYVMYHETEGERWRIMAQMDSVEELAMGLALLNGMCQAMGEGLLICSVRALALHLHEYGIDVHSASATTGHKGVH
jgi:hypothetical protein